MKNIHAKGYFVSCPIKKNMRICNSIFFVDLKCVWFLFRHPVFVDEVNNPSPNFPLRSISLKEEKMGVGFASMYQATFR